MSTRPLVEVENLEATFETRSGPVRAVRGVSFHIDHGECVGMVGESGSGKSVTARALMRLAPEGSSVRVTGRVSFDGLDVLGLPESALSGLRGKRVGMVFQDPMTSLNPVLSVGAQIDDMLRRHQGSSRKAARARTVELLEQVGIRDAAQRADDYPHQFSGGMRQRVLIAMAISCEPELLIADEPTTALDVTVQAQILRLLDRLRRDLDMSLLLITHDLGVIAGLADRIYVMLDGKVVETGSVDDIFDRPTDDYTKSLLAAVPRIDTDDR